MDQQQLLATLIQLSEEQQNRIAELLNRLEQQAQTLTRASQQAAQAANALDRSGQKTALHLQAAVRESVETALHATLTTVSQRAERAFEDAGRPLLHTLAGITQAAEETEDRLQRAVQTFRWKWGAIAGGAALAAVGPSRSGCGWPFRRWSRGGARNWSSSTRRSPNARRGSKNWTDAAGRSSSRIATGGCASMQPRIKERITKTG